MSVSDSATLTQGAPFLICFSTFNNPAPLSVTVAWFDDPQTAGAGVALINDLDLLVYEHDTGKSWRGNDAAGFDHANTVEHISFQPKGNTKYVAMVYGTSLQTSTSFGLIMTGDYAEADCASGYTQCPNGCSNNGNDCQQGQCLCYGSQIGPDCTLTQCQSDCGQGECDYAYGTCVCIEGQYGPSCALQYSSLVPMEVDQTHSTSSFRGFSVGLFAGLFVFIYIIGCCIAAVCGIVCGQKFLEWRRDRAANR